MKRKRGVFFLLRRRELCGTIAQRDFKILRLLVESTKSRYKIIFDKMITESRPASFNRHLFLNNFKTCYNVRNCKQKPFTLYKQPAAPRCKRTDSAVLFECPIGQNDFHKTLQDHSYKPCLLKVTADGWLHRTDMNTGKTLQEVYLFSQYKFKHISWEKDLDRVVLQSVQYHHNSSRNSTPRVAGMTRHIPDTVLLHLALFSVAPFKFICLMPIDKSIFGNDVTTATISTGLLVVMFQKNVLKFYNFEELLDKYCKRLTLGQLFKGNNHVLEEGLIGQVPLGLVPNLIITEKPAELLRIHSDQDAVHFGGFPWHYTAMSSHNEFLIYNLKSGKVAKNGVFQTNDLDMNSVHFHGDNSGRILHVGAHTVRFLTLSPDSGGVCTLKEDFIIPDNSKKLAIKHPQTMFTASGRRVKKRMDVSLVELQTETLHDIDYDDELGLLVLLSSALSECGAIKGNIGLYDNQTGELVREIPVDEWEEESEHIVCIDRDTVVIMTTLLPSRTVKCTVFQLEL